MSTAEQSVDVSRIFRDFERWLDAHRRADPDRRAVKRDGEDPLANKRDQLFLQWLESNPRIAPAEYSAALDEYDKRKAAERERELIMGEAFSSPYSEERFEFEQSRGITGDEPLDRLRELIEAYRRERDQRDADREQRNAERLAEQVAAD